tara:strand:- start:620 stop:1645 length:1026 start_codon:yes stop_codon:yes gene_type:complete
MPKIKKLNRKSVRTHIYNILKESSDFSSSTIAALIAAGDVDSINAAIQALNDSKRGIRQTMKSEKADSAAEKTLKAKQVIAYYLANYIASSDLSAAGDDPTARSTMFHHVTPAKGKTFDSSTMKVVEKQHKFKLKTCEILVFWSFAEMGIELTGGTELRDAKNPANYGTDSARLYASGALKEMEAEGLVVSNVGVPGVRPTGKRLGVPSDATGLSDLSSEIDSDSFRLDGPDPLQEIRKMIIKEFVSLAKDSGNAGLDLGLDMEYTFSNEIIPQLEAIASGLSGIEVSDIEAAISTNNIGEDLMDSTDLDDYADSVNEDYLDEEIELGKEIIDLDEDFDFE